MKKRVADPMFSKEVLFLDGATFGLNGYENCQTKENPHWMQKCRKKYPENIKKNNFKFNMLSKSGIIQ